MMYDILCDVSYMGCSERCMWGWIFWNSPWMKSDLQTKQMLVNHSGAQALHHERFAWQGMLEFTEFTCSASGFEIARTSDLSLMRPISESLCHAPPKS